MHRKPSRHRSTESELEGRRLGFVAVALVLLLGATRAEAAELVDLLARADTVYRGKSSAAVTVMQVKTRSYQREYNLLVWDEERDQERTLVKILGPSLWRGYSMLKIGGQLKVYDPRSDHVTVIGQSMLEDRWLGSHFTHDDLVKETRLANDYTVRPVRTWTESGPVASGATCHRLDLAPRPTAPVAWGRILYDLCVVGGDAFPTQAVYFKDEKSQVPVRTMTFTDIQKVGGRMIPKVVTLVLTDLPGESSTIRYETLRFDVEIPDAKFTEQALRK